MVTHGPEPGSALPASVGDSRDGRASGVPTRMRYARPGVDAVEAGLRPAPDAEAGRQLRQTGRVTVSRRRRTSRGVVEADHAAPGDRRRASIATASGGRRRRLRRTRRRHCGRHSRRALAPLEGERDRPVGERLVADAQRRLAAALAVIGALVRRLAASCGVKRHSSRAPAWLPPSVPPLARLCGPGLRRASSPSALS